MISNLQYITQGNSVAEHLQNAEKVMQNGVDWVQLRLKDVSEETYKEAAKELKGICEKYNAKLVINDNPFVAKYANADALHLGKNDMDVLEARKIVSENTIIGGTANNLEDCLNLIEKNVNYIGLGPFRFTTTKKNLSPVLGSSGYQQIIEQLEERNMKTPIIAIGGITENDVVEIRNTGVFGIAVSGLLTNEIAVEKIISQLKNQLK
ncbi:thiamine phosphate synthase [Aureivirga sp. CE67]|uniref:thiamine phosphate synthase n=1 Tax=Aureivirga sp. CE67 TaxID=1788983 RepID=UPI0018CB1239|nr:thiamine phosphate synthase [Aureivirga sp. CE67]